jgi:hypothetical protein
VTVSSGPLTIGNSSALGSTVSGTVVSAGGELRWGNGTFTLGEAFTLNGDGATSGNGAIHGQGSGSGILNGNITLGSSAMIKMDGSATVTINGSVTGSGADFTLKVDGSGNHPVNGAVSLGSGSFFKTSGAKVTLANAANFWTGATYLTGGTLALSGTGVVSGTNVNVALGTILDATPRTDKTLTLASGQTLSGNGRVLGDVLSPAGSAVAPGNSVGLLVLYSNLTLAGSTALEIDKANATNDLLVVSNTIAYGGSLNVTSLSGGLAIGDTFKLFSFAAYAGSFAATNLPALPIGQGWVWDPALGTISIVKTINPNPTNLVYSITGDQLTLTWPADYLGWGLQVQTNGLDVGVSNNWVNVPGATNVTTMTFTIDPANPTVFFRMILNP